MFDGGIFRGHAKGVKAHGMKDVVAPHGTETSNDITNGIVPYVPHMKVARRIREHFKDVIFGAGIIITDLVGMMIFPILLPFGFRLMGFILFTDHGLASLFWKHK